MKKGQLIYVFPSVFEALRCVDVTSAERFESHEFDQFGKYMMLWCEKAGMDDFSPTISRIDSLQLCRIDSNDPHHEQIIDGEIYIIWYNSRYHIRQLELVRDEDGIKYLFKTATPGFNDFIIEPSD